MKSGPNKPRFSLLERQIIYIIALCEYFDNVNEFGEAILNTLYAFIGELRDYGYSINKICRLMTIDIIPMTECCNSVDEWLSYIEFFYDAAESVSIDFWLENHRGEYYDDEF